MAPDVPMLHAKYLMEEELKKSGIPYVIYRPTGYFYDIVHVFRPMVEKGTVTLLGKEQVRAIGGKETYTYEEMAKMCFAAAGKETCIKRAPVFLFDVLIFTNHLKKNGRDAIIRFSKWTLTESMVGEVQYGSHSFAQYIEDSFQGKEGK